MKQVAVTVVCLVLMAGCGSGSSADPNAIIAGGAVASMLIEDIASLIKPIPGTENESTPIDKNHSKVVFSNTTDRALSITLEGPRTYEVSVGHGGDITLVVVPGTYKSRVTAPSVKTFFGGYTFQGGVAYEYSFYKPGHEPR